MKDFITWLSERGARSDMANRMHMLPPNALTPIMATAPNVLKNVGKKTGKCGEMSPNMRKEAGCDGKSKDKKNPWKDSFDNVK